MKLEPSSLVRSRYGVSLLEMLVTLAIAGVVLSKAVSAVGEARAATGVRTAAEAYASMAHLARAQAVEHGTTVWFRTSVAADSAWIERSGQVTQGKNFSRDYGVDLRSATPVISVCYTPKGYSDPDCGSFQVEIDMSVRSGTHYEAMTWLPMGQLLR